MPELPDVEVFKQYVDATSLHQRITHIAILHKKIVRSISHRKLSRMLKDRKLEKGHRHGKILFIKLNTDYGWLLFHFGMTGFFTYGKAQGTNSKDHIRFVLKFANRHQLRFHCPRLFGQVGWVADPDQYLHCHQVGPDALAIPQGDFIHRLQGTHSAIKTTLMNQSILAGIGNVYSDEILFKARIHPQSSANRLSTPSFRRIYRAMTFVLTRAIHYRADPQKIPDSWLLTHRRLHASCPRCGGMISRISIHQRSAYFCETCQRKD